MQPIRGIKLSDVKSAQSADQGRVNTIGLQGKELDRLLDTMDGSSAGGKHKRDYVRWPFRQSSIRMQVLQPGNSIPTELRVACRNISCGGVSLLHSSYLHIGCKVVVILPHPETGPTPLSGFITRCNHVRGLIHEVGVRFDKEIPARDFVRTDPFSDAFSLENVEPMKLQGCVVVVDDSEMDQRIIKHYLRETQLRVRMAGGVEEGVKLISEGCDLVLCDFNLPDGTGIDLVTELRRQGMRTPVVLCTADSSVSSKVNLKASEVNAFLAKPLTQGILLRAIAEFMMVGRAGGTMTSSLTKDHPNFPLVEAFLAQLPMFVKRLNDAIAKKDAAAARTVAIQLRGLAPDRKSVV